MDINTIDAYAIYIMGYTDSQFSVCFWKLALFAFSNYAS